MSHEKRTRDAVYFQQSLTVSERALGEGANAAPFFINSSVMEPSTEPNETSVLLTLSRVNAKDCKGHD